MPTIESVQPQLQALQCHQSSLKAQRALLNQARDSKIASLSNALQDIANRCRDVDVRITSSCESHLQVLAQRTTLLGKARAFPEDQRLRMKSGEGGDRIVKMESRNLLKHLLGIGQAKREKQAADLANTLGLPGEAITRTQVKAAVTRAEQAVTRAVEAGVRQALPEITAAFASAAEKAGLEGTTAANIFIGATTDRLVLEDAFKDVSLALEKAHAKAVDTHYQPAARSLKTEIDHLQNQIKHLQAQKAHAQHRQTVEARRAVLTRNGVVLPAQNVEALQKKLSDLFHQTRFNDIYHTNAGCEAIQRMFQSGGSVPHANVIAEIERAHGDDTFTRGARNEKLALKAAARNLNAMDLRTIDQSRYTLGLARYASGSPEALTYRRAVHSNDMLTQLQRMAGGETLLRPMRFLSTAATEAGTEAFPVKTPPSGAVVDFKILGFSSMATHSRWHVKGEDQERLYGPCSHFKVQSVQRKEGHWQVSLVEQPVGPDHAGAVELKF